MTEFQNKSNWTPGGIYGSPTEYFWRFICGITDTWE